MYNILKFIFMIKYKDYAVVFEEMPKHISLAINITNCQNNCVGCHTPDLREDIGKELTIDEIDRLIKENEGINCVIFMGEGNDIRSLCRLSQHVREKYCFGSISEPNQVRIATCLYSGQTKIKDYMKENFDYIKIGPYIEEFGPLNKETTNQRLYKVVTSELLVDVTSELWKR